MFDVLTRKLSQHTTFGEHVKAAETGPALLPMTSAFSCGTIHWILTPPQRIMGAVAERRYLVGKTLPEQQKENWYVGPHTEQDQCHQIGQYRDRIGRYCPSTSSQPPRVKHKMTQEIMRRSLMIRGVSGNAVLCLWQATGNKPLIESYINASRKAYLAVNGHFL